LSVEDDEDEEGVEDVDFSVVFGLSDEVDDLSEDDVSDEVVAAAVDLLSERLSVR
jgi:hypothetical protein